MLTRGRDDVPLVPVTVVAPQFRSLFPYQVFNAMQSQCFEAAYGTDQCMVVSSPTGSGKTVILELALARLWSASANPATRPTAIYIAPLKALTHERLIDWRAKLSGLGIKCFELTGDTEDADLAEQAVRDADLIVTTPEKWESAQKVPPWWCHSLLPQPARAWGARLRAWAALRTPTPSQSDVILPSTTSLFRRSTSRWDSFTRFRRDAQGVVSRVGLLLLDEIHLLNDPGRGPTLEAVVARMRTLSQSAEVRGTPIAALRTVSLSATIRSNALKTRPPWPSASSRCLWHLVTAGHSQGGGWATGFPQSLPRLLELSASKVADATLRLPIQDQQPRGHRTLARQWLRRQGLRRDLPACAPAVERHGQTRGPDSSKTRRSRREAPSRRPHGGPLGSRQS